MSIIKFGGATSLYIRTLWWIFTIFSTRSGCSRFRNVSWITASLDLKQALRCGFRCRTLAEYRNSNETQKRKLSKHSLPIRCDNTANQLFVFSSRVNALNFHFGVNLAKIWPHPSGFGLKHGFGFLPRRQRCWRAWASNNRLYIIDVCLLLTHSRQKQQVSRQKDSRIFLQPQKFAKKVYSMLAPTQQKHTCLLARVYWVIPSLHTVPSCSHWKLHY